MNKKYIEDVRSVAGDLDGISLELFTLANELEEHSRYNPENELYSLVRRCEISTLSMRSLASRTVDADRTQLESVLVSAHGIEVSENDRWLRIRLPGILPGRNWRDNTQFATRPLRISLVKFQRQRQRQRYRNCIIVIVHNYDESLGTMRVRDYDNIETKRYLDVIEATFLTNDSGLLCSVYQTTKMAIQDSTEFYVMEPEQFPIWLKLHEKQHT